MKTLLYTLLLLSIPYLATAQDGINWVYGSSHYTEGSHILAMPDGSWLVSGFSAGNSNTARMTPIIGRYSSNAWEEFVLDDFIEYDGELGQVSEVLYDPTTDQYHFVLGQGICDVGIPSELVSFGALGNWQTSINYAADREYALCVIPGEGFIWSPQQNPEMRWQQSSEQEIVLGYDWGELEELLSIQYWRPGTLLAQTQNALLVLTFDEDGVTLTDSYSPPSPTSTIQTFEVLDEGQVVVMENDSLRILNSELESTTQVALEGTGTNHLASDEDHIYLLQELADEDLQALFLDHNLSETGSTLIDLGDYALGDMDGANSRIALVGAQAYSNTVGGAEPINSQLFVRTYTAAGADIPDEHDVEVVGLTAGPLLFEPYPFGPCGNGRTANIMVEVKNNSPFSVDEILLKFAFDPDPICPSICDPYITRVQHYTDLDLPAGATTILPFEDFWFGGVQDVDAFEICIHITAPNEPMEMNLANNSSCTKVLLVDTDEPDLSEQPLAIFPNPVSNILSLELPVTTERITLYDGAGRMLKQEDKLNVLGQHEIDVTALPTGAYFLRAQTEAGIYTGRFVKQ